VRLWLVGVELRGVLAGLGQVLVLKWLGLVGLAE